MRREINSKALTELAIDAFSRIDRNEHRHEELQDDLARLLGQGLDMAGVRRGHRKDQAPAHSHMQGVRASSSTRGGSVNRPTQHKRCVDSGYPVPSAYTRKREAPATTGFCGNCGRTVATVLDAGGTERYAEHRTNGRPA